MRSESPLLTSLLLALPLLLSGQISFDAAQSQITPPAGNTPPDQRCVLAGRVANAQTGEPVKRATVRLMRRSGGQPQAGGRVPVNQGYSSTSDAEGNFRVENVEPGDYSLSGSRNGFLESQYGAKKPMGPGTTLTLRPGQQMTDVALALTPQAVITGKVVDEDGDPVNGAAIQVLAQQWMRGKLGYMPRNGSNTNDLGEYRIANLGPGKYYLSVQKQPNGYSGPNGPEVTTEGKPDIRPVRTFYPGALTLESATPIEVKPGQDLSGMDVRLHSAQTYHVRGKLAGAAPDINGDRINLNLSSREDNFPMFGNRAAVSKDRSFDIPGVAPGSYNLNVFVMNGPVRVMASQPVEVGAADVNDLLVTMVPPGTITGQVRLEGTAPAGSPAVNLQSSHVGLTPAEPTQMFFGGGRNQVNADGTFTIQNISPGKYFVSVNPPPGTYTKAVLYGQADANGKELDLSQGASGELQIVFRYGTAEVDGTVQTTAATGSDPSASIPSAIAIYLIPEPVNADGSGIRFGSTTTGGGFTIKNVPPGRYRAYAFEQANYGAMQSPDVLKEIESRGVEVDAKENDKKQIQLPLISADDFQQILTKLGMDVQ